MAEDIIGFDLDIVLAVGRGGQAGAIVPEKILNRHVHGVARSLARAAAPERTFSPCRDIDNLALLQDVARRAGVARQA